MCEKGHLLPDGRIVQELVAKGFVLCLCFPDTRQIIQWCTYHPTGKQDLLAGSVMMHWKREVQGILWWLLPCHRLQKPIVVNIRCFGLPSIYSLFSGKRVSTFAENPSLTLSPHNGSGLIPLPIAGLGDLWALSWVRDGHVTQDGPISVILGPQVVTTKELNPWGRDTVRTQAYSGWQSLGYCE